MTQSARQQGGPTVVLRGRLFASQRLRTPTRRRLWCPRVFSAAGPGRSTNVMNKQELARELGHSDAQKLLSGSLARLAYNGHDGFPRVIPVGFYWTGERIVVSTAPTSPKARALSSRPKVALAIDTSCRPEVAQALL